MRHHGFYRTYFWRLPWSAPLRAILPWQADPDQFPANEPPPIAPYWLRPGCVLRWVCEAIVQRHAWLEMHLCLDPYRFGNDSDPGWYPTALLRYGADLHRLDEESLSWAWSMEVERMLRLVRLAPDELGEGAWVASMLSASEHVAQVYHEWRRRYKAPQARARVRQELQTMLDWRSPDDTRFAHLAEKALQLEAPVTPC